MVMLLIRLLSNLMFQPRLAVIANSLFAAASDLGHTIAIVVGLVCSVTWLL
jgi:hypothetical protein